MRHMNVQARWSGAAIFRRSRANWLTMVLLVAVLPSTISCAGTTERLPPITWEGEHLRFATTVDRLPCGESLHYMDRRIGELATALSQPLAAGERVTYYWLPGRMELSPCPGRSDCSEDLRVYSRTMFHDHELVHVLLRDLGRSQTFLYEGMAEAFGRSGGRLTLERAEARREILTSLVARVDPATIDYPLAGVFFRFLIETYGMDSARNLYVRARLDSGLEELRRHVVAALGCTLDEVLDSFAEEAPVCYPRQDLCTANPVLWEGDTWRYRHDLSCLGSRVLEISPGALRDEAVMEIAETGEYLVAVAPATTPIHPVAIVSCQCPPTVQQAPVSGEALLRLERGRYRVIAGRHFDGTEAAIAPVEVAIRTLPTP